MAMSTPVSCHPCTFGTSGIITLFPLLHTIFYRSTHRVPLSLCLEFFHLVLLHVVGFKFNPLPRTSVAKNRTAKGRQMFTWVLGSGGWEPEH